jgi:lysophospholipase L1-like esterase
VNEGLRWEYPGALQRDRLLRQLASTNQWVMFPSLTASVRPLTFLLSAAALHAGAFNLRAEIAVKSGEKIAFLGDSITQGGWGNAAGYVRLVIAGLDANGVKAEPVPAGISGHKSNQMLARLEKDVLSKKPQWMTISCGVNDVWHGANGVPLDEAHAASGGFLTKPGEASKGTYTKNITDMVEAAKSAGVQPVILTATVIKEDLNSPENQKLAPYNAFLKKLAAEKKLRMADLNGMFHEKIKAAGAPGKNNFTSDGVHMNVEGNKLMARGVLQALGLNEAELQKAEAAWGPLVTKAEEDAKAAAAARAAKAAEQKKEADQKKDAPK